MIHKRGKRYAVRAHYLGEREWVGTFETLREAQKAERDAERELEQRVEVGPKGPTIDEFVAFWLEGYEDRVKGSTFRLAQSNLRRFQEDFAGRAVDSITPFEAEAWARKNRHRVQQASAVMNDLVRKQMAPTNPFKGYGHKGRGRKDITPLSMPDVHRLADCAERALKDYGPMFKAFILFASYQGFRAGELTALEWRDIDFENDRVWLRRAVYDGRIDTLKSGKPERVLHPEAREAIRNLPRHGDLVFRAADDREMTRTTLTKTWDKVEGIYGERVTVHVLRHAAGHHMYVTLGLKADVVAVQLGHDGPDMVLKLYGHGNHGALGALEAAFGRKPAEVKPLRVADRVAERRESAG